VLTRHFSPEQDALTTESEGGVEMSNWFSGRIGRVLAGAATVGLLTTALVASPRVASANYNDPLTIGKDNTSNCGGGFCPTPADTTLTDSTTAFPNSSFYVHNTYSEALSGLDAGFALTGDSDDGTGVFGFAHDSDAAIAARNDSGPGKKGAGISSVSSYGDGVFSTTNGINKSGVYGENLGGSGYGVVGRTISPDHPAVWGDNTGGGNGVEGDTSGGNNGVYGHASNGSGSGVYGQNDGNGYGVAGRATTGTGVLGDGAVGMSGTGSVTGVKGVSTGAGDGVDGVASNACCSAVYGLNNGTGNGVAGRADSGTGVLAASTGGTALKVSGKATFSRSGVATVGAGSGSKTVTLAGVTTSSMVIVTAQQNASVTVKAAVPGTGSFRIFLTGAAPTGGLKVAYFVLN
jgi:hypothetical protein